MIFDRITLFFISELTGPVVQVLPKVASEISGPLAHTKKITMVAAGDGPIGASRLTSEVSIFIQFKKNSSKFKIKI